MTHDDDRDSKPPHAPVGDTSSDATTEHCPGDRPAVPAPEDPLPRDLGPYRLTQRLGQGGMGVVYLAQQTHPVQREVAVKLLGGGLESPQRIARFEAERQALALMTHPNIAQVFDAGIDADGRPYFVMELVRGEPITRFCEQQGVPLEARLRMFLDVCKAVAHAHQKGVIHRDIKPSNVLVATDHDPPLPKVIDFGIAKAIEPGPEDAGLTQVGALIGTPEYMSPEQLAADRDVDTRADIYSLGVLLFELLTGAIPFSRRDLQGEGLRAMQRLVLDTEPPRPSEQVRRSTTGDDRGTPSTTSIESRKLRGELDWIVLKALDKQRARRYQTPQELAEDLRRYLTGEAVLAGPPSRSYRVGKFVRRHRLSVAAAAAVLVALLVGAGGLAVGLARSKRAEALARQEAENAERISSFLVDVFAAADPSVATGREATAADVLDAGVRRIRSELEEDPETRGRLLQRMGLAYSRMSRYDEAEELLTEAARLYEERVDDPLMQAKVTSSLAHLAMHTGRHDESMRFAEQARAQFLAAPGDHSLWLAALSISRVELLAKLERSDDARAEFDRGLAALEGRTGPDPDRTRAALLSALANVHASEGRYTEEIAALREALDLLERHHPPTQPRVITTRSQLASAYITQDRRDEARALIEQTLEPARQTFGDHHIVVLTLLSRYAMASSDPRQKVEAYEQLLEANNVVYGPESTNVGTSLSNLAGALAGLGEVDRARPMRLRALEIYEKAYGVGHATTEGIRVKVGNDASREGRYEEALVHHGTAVKNLTERVGPDHPRLIEPLANIANSYKFLKRYRESRKAHDRALAIASATFESPHRVIAIINYNLACLYALQGMREETMAYLETAIENGWDHPATFDDEDLARYHGDPEFERLAAIVRQRIDEGSGS